MKKETSKEIVTVLTIMSESARKMLKNIRKKDTMPTQKAESMLKKLKKEYFSGQAAE
ncbi:MAG: hypothetical protein IJ545_06555 [Alphaproteobacteria bacterium]|nr:hypothetical protein [Alphaproteobacteria bacterium]